MINPSHCASGAGLSSTSQHMKECYRARKASASSDQRPPRIKGRPPYGSGRECLHRNGYRRAEDASPGTGQCPPRRWKASDMKHPRRLLCPQPDYGILVTATGRSRRHSLPCTLSTPSCLPRPSFRSCGCKSSCSGTCRSRSRFSGQSRRPLEQLSGAAGRG